MLQQLLVSTVVVSGVSAHVLPVKRLENGVGRTPALGWNSWVCNDSLLPRSVEKYD